MKPNRKIYLILTGLCLVWNLTQLHAGEARRRLNQKTADYSSLADIEAEIQFGRDLAARILGNYLVLKDEKVNRYVALIGTGLAQYAGRPELTFHFGVLQSDEINAFATPGGYIFVTSAALKQMDNEAQLAGVLGHEIAHVVKRHVVKKMKIRGGKGSATGGFAAMIGGATSSFREAMEQSLSQAEEILFKKGYAMEEEIEADRFGMVLSAAAGYAPNALRNFLEQCHRFESSEAKTVTDHPPHQVRMERMNQTLKKQGLLTQTHATVRSRFHEYVH